MTSKSTVNYFQTELIKKQRLLKQAIKKQLAAEFISDLKIEVAKLDQEYQKNYQKYKDYMKLNKRPRGLPAFTYYPNPLNDESLDELEGNECIVCHKSKKFFYMGPAYGEVDVAEGEICATCIANGKAHEKLKCEFNSIPDQFVINVPQQIIDEILHRTPGFNAWQDNEWQFHCQDACQFLGIVVAEEVDELFPEAKPAILKTISEHWPDIDPEENYKKLSRKSSACGYLFKCRHCQEFICYIDYP